MLKELVNRKNLAIYPNGKWTSHHASSYDRNYANHDWDNYVRIENIHGEKVDVLLDENGHGVITRFWVGGYSDRRADLRFYIDGQSVPFWEADHTGALIGQNKSIGSPFDSFTSYENRGVAALARFYNGLPLNFIKK